MTRPTKTDMQWEWNWPEYFPTNYCLTLFDVHCYLQLKGDHSPGFHFSLAILGLQLLDFGYYNRHHVDEFVTGN